MKSNFFEPRVLGACLLAMSLGARRWRESTPNEDGSTLLESVDHNKRSPHHPVSHPLSWLSYILARSSYLSTIPPPTSWPSY